MGFALLLTFYFLWLPYLHGLNTIINSNEPDWTRIIHYHKTTKAKLVIDHRFTSRRYSLDLLLGHELLPDPLVSGVQLVQHLLGGLELSYLTVVPTSLPHVYHVLELGLVAYRNLKLALNSVFSIVQNSDTLRVFDVILMDKLPQLR